MSGTALLPGTGYAGQNFYGFYPPGGVSPTYPTSHAVYFATASITLQWGLITNANAYQIQVSTTPDFSGSLLQNVSGLTAHAHTFTDAGTNNTKRWWRWRPSFNGGANYSAWSEVGSYWVNTAGAENVSLPRNQWALINPSPVTDRYLPHDFPMYEIVQQHLYRVRERNRLGTMLSEYITMKSGIKLTYNENIVMDTEGFLEMRRFNEEVKTFFLATYKSTLLSVPTPNIWKVQFESDPELAMYTAGRQDLFTGTLTFTEV